MTTPEIPIDRFEVVAGGLDHPECCAFDRDGNLWAGGEAGQIYRIDSTGKVETIANVGGFCCGVAFSGDDSELFVCVSGVGVVRVSKSGEYRVFATHAGDHQIIAPNYLLFDRRGRLYVSDSGNWMKRNGFVLRFDLAAAPPLTPPPKRWGGEPLRRSAGRAFRLRQRTRLKCR